jgi:hypothetical protein
LIPPPAAHLERLPWADPLRHLSVHRHLGFGRTAASEREAPNPFVNLGRKWMDGRCKSGDAAEPHRHPRREYAGVVLGLLRRRHGDRLAGDRIRGADLEGSAASSPQKGSDRM